MNKESKSQLRKQFRELRRNIPERLKKDILIGKQLLSLPFLKQAQTFLVYVNNHEEVDTKKIIEWFWQQGKHVFTPYLHQQTIGEVKSWQDLSTITKSELIFFEPKVSSPKKAKLDLIIIPAIVYDLRGHRIGYGRVGWYDKFLVNHPESIKVGLAYEEQVIDKIPHEKHDIPVDIIVTPTRIINIS
jgi:5-formyltetrahydrofolate cyclo-ligase